MRIFGATTSGGGGGSVTTDGVTIQGNGTGGSPIAIKAVQTDATLTGAGTVASPLSAVGTVQTDGVTIQGNGSSGSKIALLDAITDGVTLQGAGINANKLAIKAVQTDTTLTGAGTVATPLSVNHWPLTFFTTAGGTIPFGVSQNQTQLVGFVLDAPLRFAKIAFVVGTADSSNNSDIGIYNAAGTLLANIGAQHIGSTGANVIETIQGAQTIPPGLYMFSLTSAGSALTLLGGNDSFCWVFSVTGGVTTGGALLASVTPPAAGPVADQYTFALTA